MKKLKFILLCALFCSLDIVAQDTISVNAVSEYDDTISLSSLDDEITIGEMIDNKVQQSSTKLNDGVFVPSPKKAMWLGIVLPGAGQIYNHKYWKLPIIYGGMVGCIYAMRWNNMMYTDYSRAYLDLMDDDPTTESYNSFMHLGAKITDANKARYQDLFKRRKDFYRRYRDLSLFCLLGVYALSIIDAYVAASLSQFDISRDLSLRVEPTVIKRNNSSNPLESSALGLSVGLTF